MLSTNIFGALAQRSTLARTKRLVPPPPQKRDEKLLLYHTPKPPHLAHWNTAVSGSNSQYSGALDHAKAAAEHAKASKEKNPYGVAEATLAYTWDWHAKRPWEGLEWTRGGAAVAPPPTSLPVASASTPGGSGISSSGVRTVPKISVNFPGRRSSTLSSVTPTTGAAGGSGLIARLPSLAERPPSHLSSNVNVHPTPTARDGSMPPPPIPRTSLPPSNQEQPSTVLKKKSPGVQHVVKEEDGKDDVTAMMESVLGPELVMQTPVDDMDLDSAISRLAGDDLPLSRPPVADFSRDIGLAVTERQPRMNFNPVALTAGNEDFDGDIDKEIANVLGEADGEEDDADIDAEIAETIGPVGQVGISVSTVASPPRPSSRIEPQLDTELVELLDEPLSTSQPSPRIHPLQVSTVRSPILDHRVFVDI